jgi:putative acetyltransferase
VLAIAEETAEQAEVTALLAQSDAYAAARYPPRTCHLVGVETLTAAGVRLFVARDDGRAVACGALVPAADGTAELRRMVVAEAARGQGIGHHASAAARDGGVRALRLEAGTRSPAALALYRAAGFRERGPYGGYGADPLTIFMEKPLMAAAGDAG